MTEAEERLVELLKEARNICRGTKDCKDCVGYGKGVSCIHYLNAIHLLANGVTVRTKGEWRETGLNHYDGIELKRCSVCGCVVKGDYLRFCPNCGADMRGAEHERKTD